RLKPDQPPRNWDNALKMEDNLFVLLSDVCKTLDKVLNVLNEHEDAKPIEDLLTDINGLVKELAFLKDGVRAFVQMKDDHNVYWLEASSFYRSKSLQLSSVPINVSPQLKEAFFS